MAPAEEVQSSPQQLDDRTAVTTFENEQKKQTWLFDSAQTYEQKLVEAKGYRIPQFNSPWLHNINLNAEKVAPVVHQWLRDHKCDTLYSNPGDFETVCLRQNTLMLGYMIHPTASFERLVWISKLYQIAFVMDDFLDEGNLGQSPDDFEPLFLELHLVCMWTYPRDCGKIFKILMELFADFPKQRRATQRMMDMILANAPASEDLLGPGKRYYTGELSPIASAVADIWQEASRVMPKDWSLRFAWSWSDFIIGCMKETFNRERSQIPTLEEYITIRRNTGALFMFTGTVGFFVDDVVDPVPDEVFFSPPVVRFIIAATDASNWHNDVCSVPKEVKAGDFYNLVILISHWHKCSLNEAGKRAMEMIHKRCEDMKAEVDEINRTIAKVNSQGKPAYNLEPLFQAGFNLIGCLNTFGSSIRYTSTT